MPEPRSFQYAILRVVPAIERGECINAGVVLHCRQRQFLAARVHLDTARLRALAPDADAGAIAQHLDSLAAVAAGDPSAGSLARLSASERFGWLTSPSSTVIQPSPIHTGICDDPEQMLEHLFATLVR